MANFKRGYRRTKVVCAICTPYRNGNGTPVQRRIEQASRADFKQQLRERD